MENGKECCCLQSLDHLHLNDDGNGNLIMIVSMGINQLDNLIDLEIDAHPSDQLADQLNVINLIINQRLLI